MANSLPTMKKLRNKRKETETNAYYGLRISHVKCPCSKDKEPFSNNSGYVFEGVSREASLRKKDPCWKWVAPSLPLGSNCGKGGREGGSQLSTGFTTLLLPDCRYDMTNHLTFPDSVCPLKLWVKISPPTFLPSLPSFWSSNMSWQWEKLPD